MMLNWTNDEFEKRVNLLEAEGLLKQTGGRYYPTCMIITACEGEKLYNLCEPLIKPTLKIFENYSSHIEDTSKESTRLIIYLEILIVFYCIVVCY